ncbi:MAG: PE domain-containing protein [Mycobacteriaceae bacterium]|nr:PE domain-containing protein [Mycobacteriaceae bacterium]
MSFLTTNPEALAYAAGQLQTIGSSLATENAGAAAPTTGILPAAADEVSALQAGIFATYGTLYQQIAAEAQAIHEQFVATLGLSAGSYATAEASNASASGLSSALGAPVDIISQGITDISTLFGGPVYSVGGQPFSLSGNTANFISYETGNWASAMSCLIGLAGGGLMSAPAEDAVGDVAGAAAGLEGSTALTEEAGTAALGGAPMLASLGQSTSVGGVSVPPSWAGSVTTVSSTAQMGATTAGWTTAAPQTAEPVTALPGMPGAGTAARNSGFGAPRYGVKPIVMPKPVVT